MRRKGLTIPGTSPDQVRHEPQDGRKDKRTGENSDEVSLHRGPSTLFGYKNLVGQMIVRHMWATGLLSKPRPSSGWRKWRPMMS